MNIITRRKVLTDEEYKSSACGCSSAEGTKSKAKGKNALATAQNIFQKGKGFLDKNPGIKDTLGGFLGGNRNGVSNDSNLRPTANYTVETTPTKTGMSKGLKIGLIIGGVAVLGLIGFAIYKSGKGKK